MPGRRLSLALARFAVMWRREELTATRTGRAQPVGVDRAGRVLILVCGFYCVVYWYQKVYLKMKLVTYSLYSNGMYSNIKKCRLKMESELRRRFDGLFMMASFGFLDGHVYAHGASQRGAFTLFAQVSSRRYLQIESRWHPAA